MDGNTRLCTATAAAALKETFGADGQPGSYADIDALRRHLPVGHNIAETQTVLWMRILDRLARRRTRRSWSCVDPRRHRRRRGRRPPGAPARDQRRPDQRPAPRADRANGRIDRDYVDAPHRRLRRAAPTVARLHARARRRDLRRRRPTTCARRPRSSAPPSALLSTVLQGFYQSNQATAAACQVNNLHLLRGMIGRPGCGVLQMNGQPTAQNTREMRRRRRPARLPQLGQPGPHRRARRALERRARRRSRTGRRRRTRCRSSATPSRARSSCSGSRRTNPAVSLPELARIRQILGQEAAVPGRAGRLPDRDRRARRRRAARGDLGREDRARSPTPTAPSTFRQGGRAARARPGRDLDIFLDYAAPDGLPRQGRRPAGQLATPRRRSRPGRSARAAGPATTPA